MPESANTAGGIELTSSARVKHRLASGSKKPNQLTPNADTSLIKRPTMMDELR
jgi:hypothetical protein